MKTEALTLAQMDALRLLCQPGAEGWCSYHHEQTVHVDRAWVSLADHSMTVPLNVRTLQSLVRKDWVRLLPVNRLLRIDPTKHAREVFGQK